ncbi:MAG: beta-N-acetylhexosaminidase [Lachnospiraceae bacterium]|nr:beta-N-acetylhexosaminidase [Lachnospiraceae bacterium]
MEENNNDFAMDDKRELRRKRRVRNQMVVFISAGVLLIGIALSATWGIGELATRLAAKPLTVTEVDEGVSAESEIIEEPIEVEIPEEEVIEEPVVEIDPLDVAVDEIIAQLTIEDKVAGLFFITPEALTDTDLVVRAGETTEERLLTYAVGGLIYDGDNIQTAEQLGEMLTNTTDMSKYPIFLGIEEEGGGMAPVADHDLGEVVEDMGTIGQNGDSDAAVSVGETIGTYLSELGFNTNFAPIADISANEEGAVSGERFFGTDPVIVGEMSSAVVTGLQSTGINACLKYFPGVGDTTSDTGGGMVVIEKTLEEMQASDFIPFRSGIEAGVAMIMVGHVSAPAVVGDNTQASLSPRMITEILRGELGYDGIVITDSLDMGVVTEYYSSGEASVKALQAGADMLFKPENFTEAYDAVLAAVQDGTISEERIDESLRRIYRIKYADQVQE